jgi:hypothetical protein
MFKIPKEVLIFKGILYEVRSGVKDFRKCDNAKLMF